MTYAPNGSRILAYLVDAILSTFFTYLVALIIPIFGLFAPILYFTFFESCSMMATPGKKLMGLVVVDEYSGRLSVGKAFLRTLCKSLSSILLIGYIMGLVDERGRTLHDRLVGTYVIQGSAGQAASWQPAVYSDPRIVGSSADVAGCTYSVSEQGTVIGRDPATCSIIVNVNGISRTHCAVRYDPQGRVFQIMDLGSTYGTYLKNGTRLSPNMAYTVNPGDEFYLATTDVTFRATL